MQQAIEPSELIPIFRGIIYGEYEIEFVKGYFWGATTTTSIRFTCQGYEIELFHDVNHIDYTVLAIAPDGRKGDHEYWSSNAADSTDPISQLSEEEHDILVEKFEEKHQFYINQALARKNKEEKEKPKRSRWTFWKD